MFVLFETETPIAFDKVNTVVILGVIGFAVKLAYTIHQGIKESKAEAAKTRSRVKSTEKRAHAEVEQARKELHNELQGILQIRNEEITTLRENIASLRTQHSTFKDQYDVSIVKIDNLTQENARLKNDNLRTSQEVEKLAIENRRIVAENEKILADNTRLSRENAEQKVRYDRIIEELEECRLQLPSLKRKAGKLRRGNI